MRSSSLTRDQTLAPCIGNGSLGHWTTREVSCWVYLKVVAQMVKHLPAMRETQVRFLGQEDPLEKEMAIHSSILVWKIPWTEEPDRLQSMGSQRVGHDWATSLNLSNILCLHFGLLLHCQMFLPVKPLKFSAQNHFPTLISPTCLFNH